MKDLMNDYLVMLARTRASARGATPLEVQRNVAKYETDYPERIRYIGFRYVFNDLYSTHATRTM